MTGPGPEPVAVEGRLAEDFPGFAALSLRCAGPAVRQPGVDERLAGLASRIRGDTAIEMRRETIPAAYRAFYRQLGLDPDTELPPAEAAVARRLFDGGVLPAGPLAAALELAVLETAVPVYAFDDASVEGEITIREAGAGEQVTGADGAGRTVPGRLVIADGRGPLCWLFEEPHGRGAPQAGASAFLLVSVGAPGVAGMALDEALTTAAGAIGS